MFVTRSGGSGGPEEEVDALLLLGTNCEKSSGRRSAGLPTPQTPPSFLEGSIQLSDLSPP